MAKPWQAEFWPKTFNGWRLIPRVIVAGYAVILVQVLVWFMALLEPTTQQAAFVSAVVGMAPAMFGFYAMAKPDK